VGDLLYIGSCSGIVFALDRHDGRVRWSHDVTSGGRPTSFHGDPLVTRDLLVIGTDRGTQENPSSDILAFDLETGAVRWETVVDRGIVSDIVRAGNRVLAITRSDSLLCLDLASGRRLWSYAAEGGETEAVFRSPAVVGSRAFFSGSRGKVHAVDVDTGRSVWTRSLGAAVTTGIVAIGKELVMADEHGTVHRLDQASGAVRPGIIVGDSFSGAPMALGDSLVLLGAKRSVVCVEPGGGRVRWTRTLPNSLSSSRPYLWRGTILAGTVKGALYAFRPADGMPLWTHAFNGVIRGIGQDEGALYIGMQEGMVYAFNRPGPGISPAR
jgi:outer membrane protein assembly factor BamB